LEVDEVQVWKDVDGILTADPRLVTNALPVSHVSYEEASELAYFGAQVLHPIAMQPALHEEGWSQPVRETVTYVTPRPLPNASIFSLVSGVVHFVVVSANILGK